ncbi:MAG: hypothetical protein SCARUB_02556 [Candidatus Scalindua rubra]|uniref:Transposase IS200-like domain-containing protein n=1 Tax=Candidatus Scalindua rubra TaxID=1872076 RepID=A0A1E3X9M1_9BACT|nr:MAG: hypothetical protein SCARUB_02556 [Candidatus Scalindua rubra]
MKHKRSSIRLKGYDYSQTGVYYVTICVQDRLHLFGEITNDKMVLNDAGVMVEKWWSKFPEKFPTIMLDEYIIMPNHMHGIIIIKQPPDVGADPRVCPDNMGEHTGSPLHRVMQWFKTMTTNEYIRNVKNANWKPFNKRFWQRNYYEHIVRNENELNHIREYIINNPLQWQFDRENPNHIYDKTNNTNWNQIDEIIYGKPT